jgi:ribosomal protein S18 acetylase RimI-like enzyme
MTIITVNKPGIITVSMRDELECTVGSVQTHIDKIDNNAFVWSVWVDRHVRRQGIATKLLIETERIVRLSGSAVISLHNGGGDRAEGLYRKLGFRYLRGDKHESMNIMIKEL